MRIEFMKQNIPLKNLFLISLCLLVSNQARGFSDLFPNVCTVVATDQFREAVEFNVSNTVCGFPPHPCARISYYVPQTFIEVVSHPKETFFSKLPGASIQLSSISDSLPFASKAKAHDGNYTFHAHALTVPFTTAVFAPLSCAGTPIDRFCFGAMSEHLGSLWSTGGGDRFQPKFLAWKMAPKACLLKGTGSSIVGGGASASPYPNMRMCSFDRSWMKKFPPSPQPVCTGWGFHFPRTGAVTSSDSTTASLIVASRIRTLGNEVFNAVPIPRDEKWQMITPQSSSPFQMGENIAVLRAKSVTEMGRLMGGERKNYLYVIWKKVSCTREWPAVPAIRAGIEIIKGVCEGIE